MMFSKSRLTFVTLLLVVGVGFSFAQNEKFQQNLAIADSLYSDVLQEQRLIYVQYPDNYDPNDNVNYPVAFVLDAEFLMPTVHNFQGYYSGGFTPEMILIGISTLNNRTRDLTTSVITESYGMPYTRENGKASNFAKFMADELIPYVEANYRVTSFRTLIGHSYGGLFTVYALLHHPELFSNYLAIDPSLDWDNQKLIKEGEQLLASKSYEGKSLFISLNGQLHWQNAAITIDNVMDDTSDDTLFPRSNITFRNSIHSHKSNGLAFQWKFYPNDLHGTIQFPSVRDGLIAMFEWFQMENTDKINSFETSTADLNRIIRYRVDKLEQHFGYKVAPYPEDLLNMSGYMSMDMQNMDRAQLYFKTAMEFYPNSANVYDSMSDFYERKEDTKNALKYAEMANSKEPSEYLKKKIDRLKKSN